MGDEDDLLAEHRARVRALPIVQLRKRLIGQARKLGASEGGAEDLAQRALERFFRNGAARWKRDKDPDAHFILFDTMKEMMKDAAEKKALRRTDANTELVEESPPSSDSGPHARFAAREEATQLRDELFRRVATSPLTVDVARLYVTLGHLKPAEVAEKLGVPVSRVYESTRRAREGRGPQGSRGEGLRAHRRRYQGGQRKRHEVNERTPRL